MPPLEAEIDANFYTLVHQLVVAAKRGTAEERRRSPRQALASCHRIAPFRGPDIPKESEFVDVPCNDLSRDGFSFFLPERPDFDRLVAAFGTPPKVAHVAARIVRCEDVLVDSSGTVRPVQEGSPTDPGEDADDEAPTPMILVGCVFTERME